MENEYFASINDVSKRLNVPAHTLRYWEKQFPGAIRPVTGSGGRRYYRAETVKKLTTIRDLLYSRGMTIAGVKKMLHDGEFSVVNSEPVSETTAPVMPKIDTSVISDAIAMLENAKRILVD